MADTNLPSTPADGNIKTVLVPAIEDVSAPTVAEATALTALDISCYLVAGGYAMTNEQATITDERECDTIVRSKPGRTSPTLSITGIDNTNTAYSEDANELADALQEGTRWFAIRRRGKSHTLPLVAGDKVTVSDFTVGQRSDVAAEANSVLRSMWPTFVDQFRPEAEIAST